MISSYTLTPLQRAMYASSVLGSRPWQYIEQIVVELPLERLNVDVMQTAWSDLATAHPALRAVIIDDDSEGLVQKVLPAGVVSISLNDWASIPKYDADTRFREFLVADRNAGIDATRGVPFRVSIFHLGQNHSKLVWTFPHSLLDGGSFAPLLDEVFTRYNEILRGNTIGTSLAANEEHPFKVHCDTLVAMSHAAGVTHFAEVLRGWGGSEGLVLPGVKPTRKVEISHHLTKAQSAALIAFGKRVGVSFTTVIMAAWGTVLARVSGQDDVVFGNTRNGRRLADGARGAAGCFITSVPMRMRFEPDITVGQLIRSVHDQHTRAHPFEFTPLTDISTRLDIPPGKQIFDSLVMCDESTLDQRLKERNESWKDRKVEVFEEGDTAVSVAVYIGTETKIVLEYDPAQVPQGDALSGYLVRFLDDLVTADLDMPLGGVSMLDEVQITRLRNLSGHKQVQTHLGVPCITQFEQVAAESPDRTALVEVAGSEMSFGALNLAADQMARQLACAGVLPGDHVGICMARGAGFITAILAIWKAGAAFAPMDPSYPSEFLNIIAQDSKVRFVLVDSLAPALDVPTKAVDALPDADGDLPEPFQRDPQDLAYIIFTSGSTGRPKGVMISHASLAAHAEAIIPHFELGTSDRVLQFAAMSFDVALEEIIPTLLAGSTLVLRSDPMAESITDFLEQSAAFGITVVNLPTGFWVALTEVLQDPAVDFPPMVRLVIVGGERVPLSVLRRWRDAVPDVRILNGYGPTEASITCTTFEAATQYLSSKTVPIGGPLSHAQVWILTSDGALAPEGTAGELFISGPALARGYIGDPERTNRSFVQPVFDAAIDRIYRTGDRAVWRDGVLNFLGRSDRQIKIRGFRIELGQIEAALESQEAIERAHAAIYEPISGQSQLVAWYSASKGAVMPTPETVKELTAAILPPQMRPQPIPVTVWPKTPSGKVDTDKLPVPDLAAPQDAQDAEHTHLTQKVADIFGRILDVDTIGPGTSFFDAGGNSLSLLRLMPEIERAFGQKLKPIEIYSDPTPRGVVDALRAYDIDPLVVVPIQPEGALPPLYAVHVLGDNGSFFRPLSQELGTNQPLLGLTVGLLSEDTPTTVEDIAAFYLHQIERHHPEGPLSLIAISAGSYVTMELAQQLLAAGRDVTALILLDAMGPGGRPRVGRPMRLLGHLRNLLTFGWPYLRKIRAARAEDKALQVAYDRIQKHDEDKGHISGKEIENVADFIAANQRAIEAYQVQPYPRRLTIYRAGHDRFDSVEAIRTGLGWSSVAAAGFDLFDVPGDHLGILQPPNVRTLGQRIAARLASKYN